MFIDALPVLLSEAVRFRYQRKLLFENRVYFYRKTRYLRKEIYYNIRMRY